MPQTQFEALLAAIQDVGARVDHLRHDTFSAIDRHEKRLRDLETAEAVRVARADDARSASNDRRLTRRQWNALYIGVGLAVLKFVFDGILWLVSLLP